MKHRNKVEELNRRRRRGRVRRWIPAFKKTNQGSDWWALFLLHTPVLSLSNMLCILPSFKIKKTSSKKRVNNYFVLHVWVDETCLTYERIDTRGYIFEYLCMTVFWRFDLSCSGWSIPAAIWQVNMNYSCSPEDESTQPVDRFCFWPQAVGSVVLAKAYFVADEYFCVLPPSGARKEKKNKLGRSDLGLEKYSFWQSSCLKPLRINLHWFLY